jgi:hypothetical protein
MTAWTGVGRMLGRLVSYLALSGFLLLLPVPAVEAGGGPHSCGDVAGLLRQGQPLVVIVAPVETREGADSEAYGDWVAYRDQFLLQVAGSGPCVARLTPEQYRARLTAPDLRDPFATLFVRNGRAGLLHAGMVLEPGVYQAGIAFLGEGDPAPGSPFGLIPVVVRWR